MNKTVSIIIIFGLVIALGIVFFGDNSTSVAKPVQNVEVKDGIQFITLTAKGGYTPRKSTAKANIPTILRFDTNGTFDCSSSVRIPSMNVSKMLPQTGMTEIDLGNPKVGLLQGSCGMGMYPFEIDFQS